MPLAPIFQQNGPFNTLITNLNTEARITNKKILAGRGNNNFTTKKGNGNTTSEQVEIS